ncbi:MAG: hypothetical protein KJ674_01720 [Nanoarchaeota archaeon]|nr:hypothetical protein [Nanoarchaeota archaeon]
MEELVKMSPKGQLVVPKDIREKEKFSPRDRFVAVGINGGVVFKRVSIPDVKMEFQSLSREIAKKFKENKIKKQDIKEAVKWTRESS